jgi:transposase-like protein
MILGTIGIYMKYIRSIADYSQSEVAQIRNDILTFIDKYEIQATTDAYGVSQKTLFRWRQRLRDSGGKLDSLLSKSTKPQTQKSMTTHPKIMRFI